MVTEIKEKAAIYCRVSTRGQKEEGTSLEGQYQFLKEWIKRDYPDVEIKHNVKTLEDHFSEDHTGTTFDRPVWNQVKALVIAGEIKHVFVYHMTRFARPKNEDSWMNVIEEMNFFKKHNVILHIEDDKTEGLGALASVMTTFQVTNAHIDYSSSVNKMLKGKKDRVILHKKSHTGRRFSKFGYNYISKRKNYDSPKAGTYEINDSEAKAVKIMFELYVKGKSSGEIIKILNHRGIKTKTGKTWNSGNQILKIIQDDIYKGEAKANFNWNGSESPKFEQLNLGKDFAPAIVSKRLWNQAAAIHKKNFKVKTSRKFLLSDFLTCGLCGGNIGIKLAAKKWIICHCSNHEHASYKTYCEMKDFRLETIAPAVWNEVMTVLIDSRSVIRAMERSKTDQSPVLKRELVDLEALLKEIPKRKERIRESFIVFGEDMDKAEMKKQYDELSFEEARINHRIQEIKLLLTEIKKVEIAGIEIEEWMTNIHSYLNKADTEKELLEKQRHVLSQLNIKVIVHKRYEDGTIDFEITGILPTETESDIQEITESIVSNSKESFNYPTIERTSACSYFTWVSKTNPSNINDTSIILTEGAFTFEEAIAEDKRTAKLYPAIGFRSKVLLSNQYDKKKSPAVLNLEAESEIAYKLYLKHRNGMNYISYNKFLTLLHQEIDSNSGIKDKKRSHHFRLLVNNYLTKSFPVKVKDINGKKYLMKS